MREFRQRKRENGRKIHETTQNNGVYRMTRILLSTFIPYHFVSYPRAKYLMFSFLCLLRRRRKKTFQLYALISLCSSLFFTWASLCCLLTSFIQYDRTQFYLRDIQNIRTYYYKHSSFFPITIQLIVLISMRYKSHTDTSTLIYTIAMRKIMKKFQDKI